MVSKLLDRLVELSVRVKKTKAKNINSKLTKEFTIDTVSLYFNKCRDEALKIFGETEILQNYDADWQHLIRLAHGNNSRNTYLKLLKRLKKRTEDLKIAGHTIGIQSMSSDSNIMLYSADEQILISTLEQIVPTAAESYKQGILDLNDSVKRLSYRGAAAEFREALRETLDHLAPDDDVKKESWYKLEKNQNKPIMKQKVRYILASRGKGKTKRAGAEKTVELIETLCDSIARAIYDSASLATHVLTTKAEVYQLKRYMDALLFDLLAIRETE